MVAILKLDPLQYSYRNLTVNFINYYYYRNKWCKVFFLPRKPASFLVKYNGSFTLILSICCIAGMMIVGMLSARPMLVFSNIWAIPAKNFEKNAHWKICISFLLLWVGLTCGSILRKELTVCGWLACLVAWPNNDSDGFSNSIFSNSISSG